MLYCLHIDNFYITSLVVLSVEDTLTIPFNDHISVAFEDFSNEEPCKIRHQWQHLTHKVLTTCIVTRML